MVGTRPLPGGPIESGRYPPMNPDTDTAPDTRRLLRESAPVAAILLFWLVLSVPARPSISAGLIRAGIVMALLYSVVSGGMLAQEYPPATRATEIRGILTENVRVAIPAGAWFLSGQVVYEVQDLWDTLGIPGAFTSPADGLAFVVNGAGVAVVLIYAIWVGLPYVRGEISPEDAEQSVTPGADD